METHSDSSASITKSPEESELKVVAFCSACHAMPKPGSFPKTAWYDEVKKGFAFYHQSGRKDLTPPSLQIAVEYFRSRAPERLAIPQAESVLSMSGLRFHPTELVISTTNDAAKPPAISFVGRLDRGSPSVPGLLINDMAAGGIYRWIPSTAKRSPQLIATLRNPAAASFCDLNGNGESDLVVADLGSFNPADHDQGRVVWLPDFEHEQQSRDGVPLCEGLGRVADVQPADFDGDGDTDLVVAEFGWHKTGRVLWLRNDGDAMSPKFVLQVLDRRPGTIHVPVIDLNQDGRPDFVALISQEFEVIEAFLNKGGGVFEKHRVYAADDPAFGSSGIQLVDMDGDGDQDILYANGDTFDSTLIKPYHGIQWLENTGSFPFVAHHLTSMPGVHRALTGDLDGDGDLDIVAGAILFSTLRNESDNQQLDSLIWLEQLQPGKFLRHTIEKGNCTHATLELADFDNDGDIDIATGSFLDQETSKLSAVTLWWNQYNQ